MDSFHFAYKASHSCETALLCVYNDSVTTVGKGNGSYLVILNLSASLTRLPIIICVLNLRDISELALVHYG